jgi:hypothetical protein
MQTGQSTGAIMKAGLLLAAVIVVLRIILEQVGAPEAVNGIFGVAWLYFLLPICLALKIATGGEANPFKKLLKDVFLFAVCTRLMVMITYVVAYFFHWQAPRFSTAGGGNVGPDVSLVTGILVIPVRNALFWVLFATIVGMLIGGITLWLRRKASPASAA